MGDRAFLVGVLSIGGPRVYFLYGYSTVIFVGSFLRFNGR